MSARSAPAEIGKIVGGEDRFHARHRQRLAGVDADHARVRHRAEQQLAEEHAVGAEIFGVARLARDLGDEIGRRVVLADQLVCHEPLRTGSRMYSAPRASAVRILS